ncbi:MAG TPA: Fic family protein [Rhodopila sp.]|jgi:Fic family protein|nr:Fic family protein [Rhodopila sp.]
MTTASAYDPASPDTARLGRFIESVVAGERVRAFVPPPLPPTPPLELRPLLPLLGRADRALGRLDGLTQLLPDPQLFLYAYIRKEALLSSQIEGTQSSLTDLFALEAGEDLVVRFDEVLEVSNYVAAMQHGLDRLATLPLSLRLIRELHERLLRDGRGATKQPGEFRRSQNWVGGTRPGNAMYVPPPPQEVMPCLDGLERFIHDQSTDLPPLIRAGLVHVQFETIHPFLDGNGRVGRLLITLMLCAEGILRQPLLYLSLYFKANRSDYYRLLQEVRERGTWEVWLEFFLAGVESTASQAVDAAGRILTLFDGDRQRIEATAERAGSALRVYEHLKSRLMVSQKMVTAATKLSPATVNTALDALVRLGIAREITGRQRNRFYAYDGYLSILSEGAEPIPS